MDSLLLDYRGITIRKDIMVSPRKHDEMRDIKLQSIKDDLHDLIHISANWVKSSQEHEKELSEIVDRIVKKWTDVSGEL